MYYIRYATDSVIADTCRLEGSRYLRRYGPSFNDQCYSHTQVKIGLKLQIVEVVKLLPCVDTNSLYLQTQTRKVGDFPISDQFIEYNLSKSANFSRSPRYFQELYDSYGVWFISITRRCVKFLYDLKTNRDHLFSVKGIKNFMQAKRLIGLSRALAS